MMPTRMSLKKNLMAACSIGVLAVVVTGCSSNDKGVSPELAAAQRQVSDANSALAAARLASQEAAAEAAAKAAVALAAAEAERDEAQAAATAAEAERDAAQAAATAAGEALTGAIASVIAGFEAAGITLSPEAAEGDLDALGADLLAAATALSDANTALAAAMMRAGMDEATIASLTAERDTAQTALAAAMTKAGMDAKTISDMMAQVAALTNERDAALAELAAAAAKAERLAAEGAVDERITREAMVRASIRLNRVDEQSAPVALPDGVATGDFEVTRNADGEVTVDVGDDDYDGTEVGAGSGDWTSAVLTKTNSNDTADTVVIYTDIEEPDDRLLTDEYGVTELGDALGTALVGFAEASSFPSGPQTTLVYAGEKMDGQKRSPALFAEYLAISLAPLTLAR